MKNTNLFRWFKPIRLPLITILTLIMIGGWYSVINTQIALTGQRVSDLEERLARLNRENDQLEMDFARESAFDKIEPRARAMGLRPTISTQTVYLVVKNYPANVQRPAQITRALSSRATGFIAVFNDIVSRLGLSSGSASAEAEAIR